MNKKLLALLLILVLSLSVVAFAACDKEEGTGSYAIPEGLTLNVGLYDNETLLGTVTNDTLSGVTQYRVSMTTVNDLGTEKTTVYIGYKLTDLAAKLNITLPVTIKKVDSYSTKDDYKGTYEITSIANAYITIGTEENGAFAEDSKGPRFLSDSTSASSNSVAKYIDKVIINPIDKTKPLLNVKMTQGDKVNEITIPFASYATEVNNVSYDRLNDDIMTTYFGFNLLDILNSMGKIRSSGEWMGFISDYEYVGFVCSDDMIDEDYTTRSFTKAEIENTAKYIKIVKDGETARCYSDYADVMYRSRLKNITKIMVYGGEDAATLEISWSYAD